MSVVFNFPTKILFGAGCLNELPSHLKTDEFISVLLVTDTGIVNAGLAEKVQNVFPENSRRLVIYSDIHSNPIEEDVYNGVEYYRQQKCDSIIALGGGSALDVAKTIRFMVTHEPPLEQYDDALGGDKRIIHLMPPMIAIPTTAGTGSEVGRSSVITLKSTGKKTVFFHPRMMPDLAVLDPELTTGLPTHITAATGMDAFTHCFEAFIVDEYHPMADAIALEGMKMIIQNLPIAVKDGQHLKARGEMLMAASMGATAFQKGLGMTHSMAHPLSAEFGLHHGLSNALLLPETIRLTRENTQPTSLLCEKLNTVANLFKDKSNAHELCELISQFTESLGIQMGLKNHGVSEENISKLSQLALEDQCHYTHPFSVSLDDFKTVYKYSL